MNSDNSDYEKKENYYYKYDREKYIKLLQANERKESIDYSQAKYKYRQRCKKFNKIKSVFVVNVYYNFEYIKCTDRYYINLNLVNKKRISSDK